MVDFPEGYGFAPNESKWLVQSEFIVSVGMYEKKANNPTLYRSKHKNTAPYSFVPIGHVMRDDEGLYGYLFTADYHDSRFTGTIQDICTAMCTVHRLTGVRT